MIEEQDAEKRKEKEKELEAAKKRASQETDKARDGNRAYTQGQLNAVSLLRVSLCVDGSGSCCMLDSNINQRIYIYIYILTEEDECDE